MAHFNPHDTIYSDAWHVLTATVYYSSKHIFTRLSPEQKLLKENLFTLCQNLGWQIFCICKLPKAFECTSASKNIVNRCRIVRPAWKNVYKQLINRLVWSEHVFVTRITDPTTQFTCFNTFYLFVLSSKPRPQLSNCQPHTKHQLRSRYILYR